MYIARDLHNKISSSFLETKCPNHDHFDNHHCHHHPDTLVLEWHYQALPLPSSSAPPRQSGSDGDDDDDDNSDGNSDNDDYGTISPAQYYHETPLNRSSPCKGDPSLRFNYSNLKINDSMPMLWYVYYMIFCIFSSFFIQVPEY